MQRLPQESLGTITMCRLPATHAQSHDEGQGQDIHLLWRKNLKKTLFVMILHIMKILMRRNQGLIVTQANLVCNELKVLGLQNEEAPLTSSCFQCAKVWNCFRYNI